MLNICALFHRIPDGKNYSTQFSCVPVFFCPKTPKLAFLLLRRRSLYLLLLVLFLSFSFATGVPSTRIQAQFPPLSPVRAAGNRANTWYGVRSWTKSILTFHGPQTLLRFENCSSSYCLLSSWRRFHVFESSFPSFVSSYCFRQVRGVSIIQWFPVN